MPKSPFSKVLCSKESLKEWLLFDLKNIGISISNEELEIKPYSSSCYGRYNVNKGKIIVYMYSDKECTTPYPYAELMETTIHEAVHYIQHHDPNFVRFKGVMHNAEFYHLYNEYSKTFNTIWLSRKLRRNMSERKKIKNVRVGQP